MNHKIAVTSLGLFWLVGCTSHLVFFEEDHVGLKAAFEPNNPAPAQFSVGYRRGVVAVIPQKSDAGDKARSQPLSVTQTNGADGKKVVVIVTNPHELMSLYTTFKANIGFNNPVQINHFLATGKAATSLLADRDELRNLTDALKNSSAEKGGDK
ncbi:MAG: hypothetical protein HY043_06415 [Verrucomicrobia bacterium]|nr:hypothetical protein [Verrucomicrobiota bacterium]